MINALEYTKGNIEVKIDGHRHVLTSAKSFARMRNVIRDGVKITKEVTEEVNGVSVTRKVAIEKKVTETVKESKLTGELPIVRAAAKAVFAVSLISEGVARFNELNGCVKWKVPDGPGKPPKTMVITPESDLTALPEDIQAFCLAIRTPSTIKTFNDVKAL